MRFLVLMLAAYLGSVACEKDRAPSNGAKGGVVASTSSKSAGVTSAAANAEAAQGSAPANAGGDEPVDDEAVSATDKSGVDNPETDEDDSPAADEAEE